ncbi:MAG: A/G-specific adenine glycosylase [Flavobacteriales bacterium]|jgi:A/G-specific adenine glycosylase
MPVLLDSTYHCGPMQIAPKLITWYEANKRDLPWRHTREPYAVWLSEVILQQTRVDQGMAYYLKFLQLFPTVFDLAAASEDAVLKAWQGLGYYSRARNLHATAKLVVTEYGGQFPQTAAELKSLKGIGEYTAAAIASFCYGENIPVMDGNVLRVAARLTAMGEPIDKPTGRGHVMAFLWEWIPSENPDTFNQAIMEFGALQCTPRNPGCSECVFSSECEARRQGSVDRLPFKQGKTAVSHVWMYYAVITCGDQWLVRRRSHSGIWKGLYDFPSADVAEPAEVDEILSGYLTGLVRQAAFQLLDVSEEFKHVLSHRVVHARFMRINVQEVFEVPDDMRWVTRENLRELGVSRLVDRYLQQLLES